VSLSSWSGAFSLWREGTKINFSLPIPYNSPRRSSPSLSWLHEPSLPYSCLHLLLTVLEARSASLGDHPLFILQIQKKHRACWVSRVGPVALLGKQLPRGNNTNLAARKDPTVKETKHKHALHDRCFSLLLILFSVDLSSFNLVGFSLHVIQLRESHHGKHRAAAR
jgi:hypothetical protein